MKTYENKRYDVQAKRRGTDEKWTEWTKVDNYQKAVNHACHAEEVGYLAKVVVQEKQIEELWDILGKNEYEKADAVFDAGFRKRSIVERDLILKIDQMICCHANGDIDDKRLYLLFDKLKKEYLGEENED